MCSIPDAIEAKVAKQRLAFLAYQNIVLNEGMVRPRYERYLLAYWVYIAMNYWRILGMKVRKATSRTLKLELTVKHSSPDPDVLLTILAIASGPL
jgi:hypothetical protein